MVQLPAPSQSVAVLCSGGIDSSVLAALYAQRGLTVYPLYIACGLRWEREEWETLQRFCAACRLPSLQRPIRLELPVVDLYGEHWSTSQVLPVPGEGTAAEAVELPGRNLLLLAKALTWCALHDVSTLAMAPLRGNPFADASPAFYRLLEAAATHGLQHSLHLVAPFLSLSKADVIRLGRDLPLELTLSCMAPRGGQHCGQCNKCEERRIAFQQAGVPDPTHYNH